MIKQRIFIIVLCCLASSWVFSQGRPHQEHPKGPKPEMTEEMKVALNLSPEQRAQLDALKAETEEAVQALKEQEDLDRKGKREAIRALQAANKTKFAAIFTEDQLRELRSLRKAEREKRDALVQQIDHEALQTETRAYRQQQIEPVLKAQRQKLEDALSTEDQATLAAIRSELQLAREQKKVERREERGRDGIRKERSGQRQEARPQRPDRRHKRGADLGEQFPEQHKVLEAMVTKYDEQISRLMAEMEPQRKQWRIDQEAIRAKYVPEELREEKRRRATATADTDRSEKRKMGAKIRFLLGDLKPDQK